MSILACFALIFWDPKMLIPKNEQAKTRVTIYKLLAMPPRGKLRQYIFLR